MDNREVSKEYDKYGKKKKKKLYKSHLLQRPMKKDQDSKLEFLII